MKNFILIDKPKGMTSHDVVTKLRKITGIKKIGHAGTLDPLATGLLILGIGSKATRRLNAFQKLDKEYIAKIKLGAVSDTLKVEDTLKNFLGKIKQIPPSFSAKKFLGKKLMSWQEKELK